MKNLVFRKATKEEILNHEDFGACNYYGYVHRRTIARFSKYPECNFFHQTGKNWEGKPEDRFFAMYVADGIRFLKEILVSSSISAGSLEAHEIVDTISDEIRLEEITRIPKTNEGRKVMREITSRNKNIVFL